jgi:hypothetical protein
MLRTLNGWDVENCEFLESFGQGMLANDRIFALPLPRSGPINAIWRLQMRSAFLYLSVTVHLESISRDQEID